MLGIYAAIFNLCLVFIAFGAYLLLKKMSLPWEDLSFLQKGVFVCCSIVFILFLPNIAYLFTDSRHIADYCDFDFLHRCTNYPWMNLGYFVYGALGMPFFLITIRGFSEILSIIFNKYLKYIAPFVLIYLSALGVRIGLLERFNSWEVITHPWHIVETCFQHVINFDEVTVSFFVLLLILYYWTWFFLDRFKL